MKMQEQITGLNQHRFGQKLQLASETSEEREAHFTFELVSSSDFAAETPEDREALYTLNIIVHVLCF